MKMKREIAGVPSETTPMLTVMVTDEMFSRLSVVMKAQGVKHGAVVRQAIHEYLLRQETVRPTVDPLEEYLTEETKESLASSPLTEEQRMNLTVLPPEKKERKKLVVELPPLPNVPNMEDLLG